MKLLNDDLYKLLTQRAAQDEQWAQYFFLVNACHEIAKTIPETQEACDAANIETLLMEGLEWMGKVVYEILPAGLEEFYYYMPQSRRNGSDEEYLYLYEYAADGQRYHWFGYFKDRQEVEIYTTFYSAPYIKTISIRECKNGLRLEGLYIPHKKSDWNKAHPDNPER